MRTRPGRCHTTASVVDDVVGVPGEEFLKGNPGFEPRQRRGHVLDQWNEGAGQVTVIKAGVPLATIQTYHRELKSQTAGEGDFSMRFSRYAPVPGAEQSKILKTLGKHATEEE